MVFGKIMITMCFLFFYGPPGPELFTCSFFYYLCPWALHAMEIRPMLG